MGLPIVDERAVAVLDAWDVFALAFPLGGDVGGRWAAAAAGLKRFGAPAASCVAYASDGTRESWELL